MEWHEKIISAHIAVTENISHIEHMKSDRYFVWGQRDEKDLLADGKHSEKIVLGYTDFYTKREFDPWKAQFEAELDKYDDIAWRLNSIQYEEETGFFHYEWYWEIV